MIPNRLNAEHVRYLYEQIKQPCWDGGKADLVAPQPTMRNPK